jgi:hypothetical protein
MKIFLILLIDYIMIDKVYGKDLYDYHELYDEQYIEMHDVFDLKLKIIF